MNGAFFSSAALDGIQSFRYLQTLNSPNAVSSIAVVGVFAVVLTGVMLNDGTEAEQDLVTEWIV